MSQSRVRGTAAERAHAWIRHSIMSGELVPGSMLSENDLAQSLKMSRTPIRAALTRLQDEGWVTIYPQRGALVRELTATEVRESAEVRHMLECAGVQRAETVDRQQVADQLASNLERQQKALDNNDFPVFVEEAARFHRAFVEVGGNSIMLSMYDRLHDRQALSIVRSASRIQQEPTTVIAEHRTLLQNVREGDWASFGSHLYDHQVRCHDMQWTQSTTGSRK